MSATHRACDAEQHVAVLTQKRLPCAIPRGVVSGREEDVDVSRKSGH